MVIEAAAATSAEESWDKEIAEFFRAYHNLLKGFLISCGCSEHDADDIVQDAFLAVRGRWDHVRGLDRPKAYLFKVAGRLCWKYQQARAGRYSRGDPEDHLMAVPDPADAIRQTDDQLDFEARLWRLPCRQRQVLWLRWVAGFSEADTARILSVAPGTVKSQLHDAMARLKDLERTARCDKPHMEPPAGGGQ